MLLALVNKKVVGCLSAERPKHPQLRHSCEFGMAVLRGHRGMGIGTALISHLVNWAKSMGLRRIQLSVLAGNTGAIRLYRRLGFTVEGRRKGAVRVGCHFADVVEMARRI